MNDANNAENIGDKNHDITIPDTPPTHVLSVALYQITQLLPPVTIVMPIIPPTHECVVETCISK